MSPSVSETQRLFARLHRIKGQIDAIERELSIDSGSKNAMKQIAGAKGALTGLMDRVVDNHVRSRLADAVSPRQLEVTEQLVHIMKTYAR